MQVAFELRKQHVNSFVGGTVALERGETFNVGEALQEGDGKIVTEEPAVIDRLDNFPPLKRCAVPAKAKATEKRAKTGDSAPKKKPAAKAAEASEGSGTAAAATSNPDKSAA